MSLALASLSMLMGIVLAWSGVAKARDPQSLETAMAQLGVPAPLTGRTVRLMVTWGELALACIVMFTQGVVAVLGWTAVLVLLLIYLALVVRAAHQPVLVSCNCFGATAAPVTQWTVARNGLLAAAAAVGLVGALVNADSGAVASGISAGETALASLVLLLALATALVLGVDHGRAMGPGPTGGAGAAQGTPTSDIAQQRFVGESATDGAGEYWRRPIPVAVVEAEGGKHTLLPNLAHERAVVLMYLSGSCSPCLEVASKLPQWANQLGALDFVVVAYSRYDADQLKECIQSRVVTDVAGSVKMALSMDAVPSAAILGADGLLAGGPVTGTEDIDLMMQTLVEQFASA